MQIILYKNNSEPERFTKSLSGSLTLSGTVRGETNVINPEILIEGSPEDFPSDYNYAYIPEFERYYFINEVTAFRNNVTVLFMHVDVLMSFKEDILSNSAMVDKQALAGNMYLNDGSWMHESREFYTIKSFQNGFNDDGEYILITAGA